MYRFWVCKHGHKKLHEFIPVTASFYTLNEANEWMIKHSFGTDETLYVIRADKDMWDDEDIERLKRIEGELRAKAPVEWLKSAVQANKELERDKDDKETD